ncbi:hypothetical protein LPJ70_002691, partial [Coemansia sp. RSA 2708]
DRTQSTAFIKKGNLEDKRLRTGTATSVNMANANQLYYTELPKLELPTLNAHTAGLEHTDKVMQIDDGFLSSLGEEHYPGNLGNDFKLFGTPALLYRRFTAKLVSQLAQYAEKAPERASVLDGKNGVGKSAELLKVASVAASSGYLVIYAHSTTRWVDSSRPYALRSNSDQYMQLEIVSELLRGIGAMNSEVLSQIPLGKDLVVGKKTLTATKTLADLVDLGVRTPALAHNVFEALLAIASTQTNVPVLLAVDEVNTLWSTSNYRDHNDEILPASRLRLISSLLPFFEGKSTLAKGWVLGATSYSDTRFMPKNMRDTLNPAPKVPVANRELAKELKAEKLQNALPFSVLRVGTMSAMEARALMNFYHRANIIASPVTEALVAKRWIVGSGNPRQMFAGVTSFF